MADHDRPASHDARPAPRDVRARLEDHAAIGRLSEELLPSLIAKLGASGLGEIEVREDDWRVRLRRPADPTVRHDRRSTDRPSRVQPGHLGHGHAPAAVEGHRSGRGAMAPVGPGAPDAAGTDPGSAERLEDHRAVATSPAVGVFQPRPDVSAGTKVRAGDRLGFVDLLGVPQEVVAPVDGIVGASLVEAGEAVEYGQALIRIELASPPARTADGPRAPVGAGEA